MRFKTLWNAFSQAERKAFADKLGANKVYLDQLAVRWNGRSPSIAFMKRMADAHENLSLGELAEEFAEPVAKEGA